MKKRFLGKIAAILLAALFVVGPITTVVAHASPILGQSVDSGTSFWDRLMGNTELTEYEKEQQELPLSQRDRIIAEPGLMMVALVILVWFVWKIRRDMKKIKARNEEYDRQQEIVRRQLAEMDDDEDDEDDVHVADEDEDDALAESEPLEESLEEIPTVEAEIVEMPEDRA